MTCSVVPTRLAISRLVKPSHTSLATRTSLGVSRSHGCIILLLLLIHGGGEPYALAPLGDARPQEQCAQVLLYGSRADVQLLGNLFVAATLHQQVQDVFIAMGDFDFVEINHVCS